MLEWVNIGVCAIRRGHKSLSQSGFKANGRENRRGTFPNPPFDVCFLGIGQL